ncbi:unnamed protein product, partial [Didymodactylos carnosus]
GRGPTRAIRVEDKKIHVRLNVPPPLFYGKELENVNTWLFQVEEIFKVKNVQGEQQLHYVSTLLREAALQWWHNERKQINDNRGPPIRTFDEFKIRIKSNFQAPHHQQMLRRQLRSLRQTRNVQTYVYDFRNILGQIDSMDEMDKVMYFQEGLRGRAKAEVGYRAPTTLNDAIQVAITFDTAHFSKQFATATVYDEQDKSASSSVELNKIWRWCSEENRFK